MPSAGAAADPAVFNWNKYSRVNFLDLNIRAVHTTKMLKFEFGIYRRPGISHVYL